MIKNEELNRFNRIYDKRYFITYAKETEIYCVIQSGHKSGIPIGIMY